MHPEVDFKLLDSGDGMLFWTSWRDGHNHIYLYRFDKQDPLSAPAKMVAQLTHGDWEVESLDGMDEQQGVVYFSANEGDWRQRNEFAGRAGRAKLPSHLQAGWLAFRRLRSQESKYYVDDYSALTTPPSASVCSIEGSCRPFWQARSVEAYHLLTPKLVDFKAADGTTTLQGILLLPSGGPMIANGKVPLILNPYGGPGAQTVRDAWFGGDLFDQILARRGSRCCMLTIAAWRIAAKRLRCPSSITSARSN